MGVVFFSKEREREHIVEVKDEEEDVVVVGRLVEFLYFFFN